MQNILLGALIGYGAYWVLNTANGDKFISSARTTVGQIDKKLSNTFTPKAKEITDGTCTQNENSSN